MTQSHRLAASLIVTVSLGLATVQCHPRFAGRLFGTAIVAAAIIGTASVIAAHDAHFHTEYCGHARRWHSNNWVYYYNGHWEYHSGGQWYAYPPSGPPEMAGPPPTPAYAPPPPSAPPPMGNPEPPAGAAGPAFGAPAGGPPLTSGDGRVGDVHFVLPDEYLVASDPLGNNTWLRVLLAKMLQPASDATNGMAKFLLIESGKELSTQHYWKTRPATAADYRLGQLVMMLDRQAYSLYQPPASREEARRNWFTARIADLSDLPQGHLVTAGGYKIRPEALRVPIEGPDAPKADAPPSPPDGPRDAHYLHGTEYFVAENPLGSNTWIRVHLAKLLQPASDETKGQAKLLVIHSAREMWTEHFWSTRPATPADHKIGQAVIMLDRQDRAIYVPPTNREQARGAWFMAKITDTSDLFKGYVNVSGGYKINANALRVAR